MKLEETSLFAATCAGIGACPVAGTNSVEACAGYGTPAVCLCESDPAPDCDQATLGCTGDGRIKLCLAGAVVVGDCNNCTMTPSGYFSCTR